MCSKICSDELLLGIYMIVILGLEVTGIVLTVPNTEDLHGMLGFACLMVGTLQLVVVVVTYTAMHLCGNHKIRVGEQNVYV
jgi:hypothetical protein